MGKYFLIVAFLGIEAAVLFNILAPNPDNASNLDALKTKYSKVAKKPADHSKFAELNKHFNNPTDVTRACISCHNERDKQIMATNHWTWQKTEYMEGKGIVNYGKINAINNFCIAAKGNEGSCAKCHAGFGMGQPGFAFSDSTRVDCIICHDNSETYMKGQDMDGYPDPKVDLAKVAQSVGKPKRSNCGVCHFYGGGGNNVKHGDLEEALFEPNKELDVHMAVENMNLQCVDCHKTTDHKIKGNLYSVSSMDLNRLSCEECHSATPHKEDIINEHTLKVACQTCHIPTYAKANATKLEWDWSTAGDLRNGEPYEIDDKDGNHIYLSIKGSFKWGKNLKPDYVWFNGKANHYLMGEVISDTTHPVQINTLYGSYSDVNSKITPVKIHLGNQPYDPINHILITPKLYADKKGEGAYWQDFNWQTASEVGMKDNNLPFSGKVGFIKTVAYWPVNHMVAPKEESVNCTECHTKSNSRLAGLGDFYMPARDHSSFIDTFGITLIAIVFGGSLIHGGARIVYNSKKNKKEDK
ncbi:MAG TPA: tetrathionate reductase family octaheme c-type cytochrome [Candidatus Kapabacteria bacterium]|nr:tetrathionate reductase family octaheme c-type cytochrome [Candidatus Kapabacteria bacterium]